MNYRVFTYGTLMKGRSNHHYVKDEQYLYDGVLYDCKEVEVETENGSEKVLFYEYIEDTSFMKTRKPEGKWSVIRQDID